MDNAEVYPMIPIQDLERAKKFYTEILSLTMLDESMPGLLLLKAKKEGKVMLFQRAPTKADHTVAAFVVDDIEKTVEELKAKGVTFEQYDMGKGYKTDEHGIMTMGPTKAAWFKDTEGNILGLNNRIKK